MSRIIGIDLGTTNSCSAIIIGKRPRTIENTSNLPTTPSVIALDNGKIVIGDIAKRQIITNPNVIYSIKRKMGTTEKIMLGNVEYSPEQLSSEILKYIKKYSEEYLGEEVSRAIITVPAYFNNLQRSATIRAGELAGFTVERIINEPTAAALAYGIDRSRKDETILVYDLGGGTFDVSILELSEGAFHVITSTGDNNLGGDDFDNKIGGFLIKKFFEMYNYNLTKNKMALQTLKIETECAKKLLSKSKVVNINIPFFINEENNEPLHLNINLSLDEFNEMIKPLIDKTISCLYQALKEAKMEVDDIDEVIFVGGSTKMEIVKTKLGEIFHRRVLNKKIDPDFAVAYGAAIQGGILEGRLKRMVLLDVTPFSLGIALADNKVSIIIPKNQTIPTEQKKQYMTSEDNQIEITINVLQGEKEKANENTLIGSITLGELESRPAGETIIEVSFKINENGVLNVSAIDLKTGKETKATLKSH